jgi:hypothetical protein
MNARTGPPGISPGAPPAVEAHNLAKSYDGKSVLLNFNFVVPTGPPPLARRAARMGVSPRIKQ